MAKHLSSADLRDLEELNRSARRKKKKEKVFEVASSTPSVADAITSVAAEPEVVEISPQSGAIVVYSAISSEMEMHQDSAMEEGRAGDPLLPQPTGEGVGAPPASPFEGEGGEVPPALQLRREEVSFPQQPEKQRGEVSSALEPPASMVEEEENKILEPPILSVAKSKSLKGILSLADIEELERGDKKRRRAGKKAVKASFPFLYAPKIPLAPSVPSIGIARASSSSPAVIG